MELIDFKEYINFTAIDFETATASATSICQIGAVKVVNGEVVDTLNLLVQPPDNKYIWQNTRVHGIKANMTKHEPTFDELWPQLEPYINNSNVVAHNAQFDCTCLAQTLSHYKLQAVPFKKHCTVQIYKKNLKALCQHYSIELNHHDALSDAKACAQLFLKYLRDSASGNFKLEI